MTVRPETFAFVAELVRRRSAIRLEPGKEYLVDSRLRALAADAGAADVDEYVGRLRRNLREDDASRVVEALTTNETSWFRDVQPFEALRTHIVPALTAGRTGPSPVRVWSAGCSTGQEPYSVLMVLQQLAPAVTARVLATDLSEQVLGRARSGRYSQLEVNRGLPVAMLVQHFTRVGADWQVAESLRSQVSFVRHNLLDPPPAGGPFDVVFLRNVLIYFDLDTKRSILARVRRAMSPGGFLVLGSAETTVGIDDVWQRVAVSRTSVYRNPESLTRPATPVTAEAAARPPAPPAVLPRPAPPPHPTVPLGHGGPR